jgi:hypothetical protein
MGIADTRAIRLAIVFQIASAAFEERLAVVAFIGEDESRGNR